MRLKNYNEDLVLETAKLVLRDRKDVKPSRSFVLDVAAYTLNRIPPKYITSERGFTRELMMGNGNGNGGGDRLVNIIELIALINRAIDIVARRRRALPSPRRVTLPAGADLEESLRLTYFYNMPHIFGRLVDARTGSPVVAASATLWVNDQLSVPAEPGWQNPYRTNEQTSGYFSFWPQAEMGEEDSCRVELRIGFDRQGYESWTLRKNVRVAGEFFVHDYIRPDKVLDLGSLSLQPAGEF
jgi:hypothetical protein